MTQFFAICSGLGFGLMVLGLSGSISAAIGATIGVFSLVGALDYIAFENKRR